MSERPQRPLGGGGDGGPAACGRTLHSALAARTRTVRHEPSASVGERVSDLAGGLGVRIAALALVTVFVQAGIVSEISIFGVRADLSPLVVAFVGFLCGSTTGALTGFGIGLLVDLTLVQTLGLTSLIFTLIGYWSGRLRELRDPQATLLPLALGAFAAFCALAGYALVEFLLGVDAPVSVELVRQIVLGTIVDTIVAAPVWALVRRVLQGRIDEDPRRRRRRAYTTGGLSPLHRSTRA
jgi:rod shape-determining protein MreD